MRAANFSKALLLLVLLLMAAAMAQKAADPKYDVATETKLKGVVDEVKEVPKSCLGETGTHLLLRTDKGAIEVQVAPTTFLKDMEVAFAKGDQLEILASKVEKDGNTLYLARQVTRNNNQLIVRDPKGGPVWTWMKKG